MRWKLTRSHMIETNRVEPEPVSTTGFERMDELEAEFCCHRLCQCSVDKERRDPHGLVEAFCRYNFPFSTLIVYSFYSRSSLPLASSDFKPCFPLLSELWRPWALFLLSVELTGVLLMLPTLLWGRPNLGTDSTLIWCLE